MVMLNLHDKPIPEKRISLGELHQCVSSSSPSAAAAVGDVDLDFDTTLSSLRFELVLKRRNGKSHAASMS